MTRTGYRRYCDIYMIRINESGRKKYNIQQDDSIDPIHPRVPIDLLIMFPSNTVRCSMRARGLRGTPNHTNLLLDTIACTAVNMSQHRSIDRSTNRTVNHT